MPVPAKRSSSHIETLPEDLREDGSICDLPVCWSIILSMTSKLEVRLLQRVRLRFQKSTELTPAVVSLTTARETLSERDCALIEQELHILCFLAITLVGAGVSALIVAISFQRLGAVDEADVEDTGEGFHVRYDKGSILGSGLVVRNELGELCKTKCGQDCGNVGVVAEVEVQSLRGWESGLHACEGD